MTDLRSRILSGSGPDRELDAEILVALGVLVPTEPIAYLRRFTWATNGKEVVLVEHYSGRGDDVPPLTDYPIGIGHCIALMGEVLEKGFEFDVWIGDGMSTVRLWPCCGRLETAEHEELPRALLAAILDAKAQEAG